MCATEEFSISSGSGFFIRSLQCSIKNFRPWTSSFIVLKLIELWNYSASYCHLLKCNIVVFLSIWISTISMLCIVLEVKTNVFVFVSEQQWEWLIEYVWWVLGLKMGEKILSTRWKSTPAKLTSPTGFLVPWNLCKFQHFPDIFGFTNVCFARKHDLNGIASYNQGWNLQGGKIPGSQGPTKLYNA